MKTTITTKFWWASRRLSKAEGQWSWQHSNAASHASDIFLACRIMQTCNERRWPNLFTRLLRPTCYAMTLACHAIMKTCNAIMLTCNATTNIHEHQSCMGVANRMTQVPTCLACWHAFLGSWSSSAFASSLIKRENWDPLMISDAKNRRRGDMNQLSHITQLLWSYGKNEGCHSHWGTPL